MSVDEEKAPKKRLMYAIVYYLEDNKLKRTYKGMYLPDDDKSGTSIWRLSNFLDDLMLTKSDCPIVYGMICTGYFPVEELDELIKSFLQKHGVKIEENEQTTYHG